MSHEESPKLYATKPKRSKPKQSAQHAPTTTTTTVGTVPTASPPPPTPPVKESFARRYKFLWPLLLAVNFTVGAYLFTRTRKKDDVDPEETKPPNDSTTPTSAISTTAEVATATITDTPVTPSVVPPMPRTPIPEDQQRKLFKWILEEKRKVKPLDAEEKKRIDEEKAILKEFIRAKSVPSL